MTYRFLAEGSRAKVVAKLIEVDLANGSESVRLTIDSSGSPTAAGYRFDSSAPQCDARWRFDFKNKAYYIEATLTVNDLLTVGSAAGIQIIKINFHSCL